MRTAEVYGAHSRALTPPGGDAHAFVVFDLPEPEPSFLQAEHTALFGRAGRPVLSPYEGSHRETGLHEILAAYAESGLAPDASFRDRPDHVSVELAFMEGMTQRSESSLRRGRRSEARSCRERAREFFLAHIWTWVPDLFDSMARVESFTFHRALALPAVRFLRSEGDRMRAPRPVERRESESLPEPRCRTCGAPLGVSIPESTKCQPPWGSVCLRCRLREDLRRLEP
ncbi:MAG: TorD/DmsD family molecular chaperone [Planctomycetota bacterium]|jgi:TorA maturation chaperone TorD